MHVIERELLIIAPGKHAAPGVENHHCLSTGFNLRIQIQSDAFRQFIEQSVQRLRIGIHHFFDHGEGFAAAAFHHVGRQRPRAAGKTNQRHFAFQFATNGTHRVHHVTQFIFRVRNWQFIDVSFAGDWRGKTRTFSGFKIEP